MYLYLFPLFIYSNYFTMSNQLQVIKAAVENPLSIAKFVKLVSAVQRIGSDKAADIYELEKFHFMKEIQEKKLEDSSQLSAMGVFLDVVSNGLSFASGAKHVYLMSRNIKVGDNWEKCLVWSATPDGKIYQCQRSGAIDHVTKPVMVYDGEPIKMRNLNGMLQIDHEPNPMRKPGALLIGGYVYVVFKGGAREAFWMDLNDVERLKGYSAKNNKTAANALYTSGPGGAIDTGFFGAKLISHALKNIRKNAIASAFEVEAEEAELITSQANDDKMSIDRDTHTMTFTVSEEEGEAMQLATADRTDPKPPKAASNGEAKQTQFEDLF